MKHSRTHLPKIMLKILLGMFLFAGLAFLTAWGCFIYQDVERLRQLAGEAKAIKAGGLQAENLPRACDLAERAAPAVEQLQGDVAPFLWVAMEWERIPFAGRYLHQADAVLDYLASLSQAGVALCRSGMPLWRDLRQKGAGALLAPGFAEQLAAAAPGLLQAEGLLREAQADAGNIDPRLIPEPYRGDFIGLNANIPLALRVLDAIPKIPSALQLIHDASVILDRALLGAAYQPHGLDADTLAQVNSLAARVVQTTGDFKGEIQPLAPLWRGMDPDGAAGQYLEQSEPLLDYMDSLARAGISLSQAAGPLLEENSGEDSAEEGEADAAQPTWYRLLISKQPEIAQAQDLLQQAAADRARIDARRLPADFQAKLSAADHLLAKMQSGLRFLQIAPRLMGSDKPQTYLIMVQNRDELRATGGFITAFGLLQLNDGRTASLEIDDTDTNYMSEVVQAPEPMRYIMDEYYLVARDANWSPDFPTAARYVQKMFALMADPDTPPTNGVIAFDQGLLPPLLKFLGPLTLADGTEVNAGNVEAVMVRYKEEAGKAGRADRRKDFMKELAPSLIDRLHESRPPQQQIALAKLLYQEVQQGHLQVFFNDPQAQQVLHLLNMDGSVRPGEGDFLMLVDSNVNSSKTDAFIQRSLEYQVDLSSPRNPTGAIRMQYQHTQAGAEPCHQNAQDVLPSGNQYYYPRCYWDYWRLLAASGARLLSAQFDPVPADYFEDGVGWKNEVETAAGENGTQMFAGLVVVPEAQAKEVALELQLPAAVVTAQGEHTLVYRLRIQKQAGIDRLPVEVRVAGPQGYYLASPPPGWRYDPAQNLATWKGDIQEPQDFSLEFTAGRLP